MQLRLQSDYRFRVLLAYEIFHRVHSPAPKMRDTAYHDRQHCGDRDSRCRSPDPLL